MQVIFPGIKYNKHKYHDINKMTVTKNLYVLLCICACSMLNYAAEFSYCKLKKDSK